MIAVLRSKLLMAGLNHKAAVGLRRLLRSLLGLSRSPSAPGAGKAASLQRRWRGLIRDVIAVSAEAPFAWYRVNVKTRHPIMIDEQPKRRASTTGTLVGTRFQTPLLDAVDSWRKAQDDLPTRPEAVRRLVELGMKLKSAHAQSPRHANKSDNNT